MELIERGDVDPIAGVDDDVDLRDQGVELGGEGTCARMKMRVRQDEQTGHRLESEVDADRSAPAAPRRVGNRGGVEPLVAGQRSRRRQLGLALEFEQSLMTVGSEHLVDGTEHPDGRSATTVPIGPARDDEDGDDRRDSAAEQYQPIHASMLGHASDNRTPSLGQPPHGMVWA